MKLVIAITGASGVIYGKRLLEVLQNKKIETHLIISKAAEKIIEHELETTKKEIEKLASYVYSVDDLTASIASGSFKTDAMIIIPCSMKTLAGIAHGYSENLILRVADVMLKEKRKLILVPRETPLNPIHIDNMLKLARQEGVTIAPAMPAFYHKPTTISAVVDFVVGKILDLLDIEHTLYKRWK
jgi:4-hydroxy-3-polyprenylbenzoate decarboxylase